MATVDGGQLHSKAQTSSRVLLSSAAMAYSGSLRGLENCITLAHLYQDADDKSFLEIFAGWVTGYDAESAKLEAEH